MSLFLAGNEATQQLSGSAVESSTPGVHDTADPNDQSGGTPADHSLVPHSSPVFVTLSPSVELEASSPVLTSVPEGNASSGADPLEQEGNQEGNQEVLLSKTHSTAGRDPEGREHQLEASGESGVDPETEPGASSPSELKITLIPQVTLTAGWEPEPSTLQESRSGGETSAGPPVLKASDEPVERRTEGEGTCCYLLGRNQTST